jgi:AcrR family transcriptional regulator
MSAAQLPPRRKDGRRERTSNAIKAASSKLFFEQGVQRTTIDEIAETAGVSVGSVYVHFGSKDALYLALVEEAATVNATYVADAKPSDSPLQRVFNAGDAYVRFALENPVMFRLIAMQGVQPTVSPELETMQGRIVERVEERLVAIGSDLAQAMAAGEILNIPVETTVKFLWATWTSVIGLTLREDRMALSAQELHVTLAMARNVLARGLGADISAERVFSDDPLGIA